MLALAALFIVAGIIYGAYWLFAGRFRVGTDDAYVHGNQIALMSQVSGTVTAVSADDTDRVSRGELLVSLDRSDARIALDRSEAQLGQTVRHVRELLQQEAEQTAVIAERRTEVAQSRADYVRGQRLIAKRVISSTDFEHRRTRWQTALAQLQQARHRLAALRTQTAGVDLRQQASVRLAIAAVRSAYLDVARTRIVSPVAGYVARRTVQVGQQVRPGTPLMALVPLDPLWVVANFKETQLGRMRIGQPATVTSDLYGGSVTFHGRVAGIGAGTGSVFELLPPQNATGNWIKVVQRVPVRIALDPGEQRKHPLRLGLSLHVTIDVRDTRGPALSHRTGSEPLYRTDVYGRQLDGLRQLITHIIDANAGGAATAGAPGDGG
jgi:membrane fusion protein (multidrug efflux system)